MKCFYHPNNLATARCSACDSELCPACDHRIKGVPYCQDCIVAGIDILHRNGQSGRRVNPRAEDKSPFVALVFSLIPGLGAAYNGQYVKALVHFLVTVGLWTLADIFQQPLVLLFAMAGAAFYFYSLYDAYSSARHRRSGEDLQAEDERIKNFLREKTGLWGGLLLGIGGLAVLNMALPWYIFRYWPVLLIFVGLYLIWGHNRDIRGYPVRTAYRTPPPSVISPPSSYDRSTGDFAQADSRYDK